jgi:hypothetical protein
MQIVQEKAPIKKQYTKVLRSLTPGEECAILDIEERKKVDVIITRLKKESMEFQTHKDDQNLKVYRLK